MKAIKDLYKIGYGPSSSHTIGPMRFAKYFKDNHQDIDKCTVTLCGSLALTGLGHKTDAIIKETLKGIDVKFEYNVDIAESLMIIEGYKNDYLIDTWHCVSLGGGSIKIDEFETEDMVEVYKENSFKEIYEYVKSNGISLIDYVNENEPHLRDYLKEVIKTMCDEVERGLSKEGLLNKRLSYYRNAKQLINSANDYTEELVAYAYAACEENADGAIVVTAPTLGSCGILASLIYYLKNDLEVDEEMLVDILSIAGVFGNLVKTNATISGAIGGCQAEVGTAISMASAGYAYYKGLNLESIEYAAEIGIEHHLGLTCDPVLGYVIVPCIERNAVGILRVLDNVALAKSLFKVKKKNIISFDMAVNTMNYTGKKIASELKETSLGGLALEFKND